MALYEVNHGDDIGLAGWFSASAHLVLKPIKFQYHESKVYVFARNPKEREFALEPEANWAGDSDEQPPEQLHCIIDTTPVWKTVLAALEFHKPGGRLVINAIRKESVDEDHLREFDYARHLWMEKEVKSVANVTSDDVRNFLDAAAKIPLKPDVKMYSFEQANKALMDIKNRKIRGAKVLKIQKRIGFFAKRRLLDTDFIRNLRKTAKRSVFWRADPFLINSSALS